MNSPSDNQLMEEVRDGKVEKLAILFERHHVILYNFFLRLTANRSISEDLVQDVFFRILRYRHTYRGESKFTIWMYQISRNAHVDYLRKRKEEIPLDEQWTVPLSREQSPAENLEQEEKITLLRQALAKLPLKKREILVLSRFHNLKYREIAELLSCNTGTVKAYVHRATKQLGEIYFELSGGMVS
ncbi:MAG: sigma-70 family RNA polymerase sigma factor [Candidatus Aminicenantes bacterium]|nr:sigma-70 family RNA polymerase sigma factor [Candidatus Aminicenantes bacterium]